MKSLSANTLAFFLLFSSLQTLAQVNETDSLALVALYNNTDGANWTTPWDLTQSVSTWGGVTIESDRVTALSLYNGNLVGSLPEELSDLGALEFLNLGNNTLLGQLPNSLGDLSSLEFLYLTNSLFNGGIPEELGNLTKIKLLWLDENSLSGEIPIEISNLSTLVSLDLSGNTLSGEIPNSLGDLSSLEYLDLSDNSFNGEIPLELGNLTNIKTLSLYNNSLSGRIPKELGGLESLEYFHISDNSLSGSLPAELGNLINLNQIWLQRNSLSGNIPAEIASITTLSSLLIASNDFTGLPSFSASTSLNELSVPFNAFEFDDLLPNASLFEGNYQYFGQSWINIEEVYRIEHGESISLLTETPDDGTNEYQWYVNNKIIDGANNSTYIVEPSVSIEGTYHCLVSNLGLPDFTLRRNDIMISFSIAEADSLALVALYNSADGANWTTPWDLTQPVSTWEGVTVINGRVAELSLSSNNLSGMLPDEIGDLTKLVTLEVRYNSELSGEIPSTIGNLTLLTILDLRNNSHTGSIPIELGNLNLLEKLALSYNDLSGAIPEEIGSLSLLNTLLLRDTGLSGEFPSTIWSLDSLESIDVYANNLDGNISSDISAMSKLRNLDLADNNFSGNLPSEIGNLPIELLYLSENNFSGTIPDNLSNLKNINDFNIGNNSFSGSIPDGFSTLQTLQQLIVDNNQFEGLPDMSGLENLSSIAASNNKFEFDDLIPNRTKFASFFRYSPQENIGDSLFIELQHQDSTVLRAETPDDGTNNYQWVVDDNVIEGAIHDTLLIKAGSDAGIYKCYVTNDLLPQFSIIRNPIDISFLLAEADSLALVALYNSTDGANWSTQWDLTQPVSTWEGVTVINGRVAELSLSSNNLSGMLPDEIGDLSNLEYLDLTNNSLSGTLIPELGNLINLIRLSLRFNSLSGEIPSELGNLSNLKYLELQRNSFNGEIPIELGDLTSLVWLFLDDNSLSGELPSEISNLIKLEYLDINDNLLSGEIPADLGNLIKLKRLALNDNSLSGKIPIELGNIEAMEELYLERNSLSGSLPAELADLVNLEKLWVHNNTLSGNVPAEITFITTLSSLSVRNNAFTELPDFSVSTSLGELQVSSNAFEFEDLLPNSSFFTQSYYYSPQAKLNSVTILSPDVDEEVVLSVVTFNDGNNAFQWYKDDNIIEGAISSSYSFTYSLEDSDGIYHCAVSNPALPDFSLIRNNIFIGSDISPVNPSDSLALIELYNETNGASWQSSNRWDLDDPVSTFEGVTVENERVTELLLSSSGFSYNASIPDGLLLLDSLSVLDLRSNSIRSIPDFSQLKTIDELDISNNAIPVWDIAKITSLVDQGVNVSYHNQNDRIQNSNQIAELDEEIIIKASFDATKLKDDGLNSYSWYRNGALLEGEVDSVLVFTYNDADAGIYHCEVTHPKVNGVTTTSNHTQINVLPTDITLSNNTIREQLSIATQIGILSTIDPEADDEHTYEIVGGDISRFFITDGTLRSNVVFDYSTSTAYSITIRSTDKLGLFVDKGFVIEIIEDVDETPNNLADFGGPGRHGAVSFTIGDDIYIGLGDAGDDVLNDFWKYEASTSSWVSIAPFIGSPRKFSVAFVADGKAYVGLGCNNGFSELYNDFYEFDPTTEAWTQVSSFGGTARYSAVSFGIDDIGYVGTGKDEVDETKDFWSYDHSSDSWTQVAEPNTAKRQSAVGFSINGKGYVSGGAFFDDSQTFSFSDIQEYDPVADEWTERIDADGLNLSITDATVSTVGETAYIFYGNKRKVVSYNTTTNDVENLEDLFSLEDSRYNGVSFTHQGSVYFGLGYYTEGFFDPVVYPTEFNRYEIQLPEENVAPTDIILSEQKIRENIARIELYALDNNTADIHNFSLVAGSGDTDNEQFSIDGSFLQPLTSFDFERKKEFSIRLLVEDEAGASLEKSFLIEILDANERPTNIEISNSSIVEDEPINSLVGVLSTEDQDANESFTYSLITGNEFFYINEDELLTNTVFDFQDQNSYDLTVNVEDAGGLTFRKFISISIERGNEAPTDISIDNNSVDEGMPAGTVVGVLSSTDINESDTHTYTLVSDFGHFTLRGDTLVTNEIFDFNIAVAFFLQIQSTDDGGLSFIKEAIRIDINDLNDVPTDLLLSNTEISENLTEGTLIGELNTIDYDLADTYTYTIIGPHPEFRIEGNQLLSNVVFDFEMTSTYEISLQVEDDRGANFEKNFTITIIDEEDPLGALDENKDLNFYPNPTKDWLHLHLSNDQLGLIELSILDVAGRVILSDSVTKEEENLHHKIDVKNLTKGVFFIKVIVNGTESLVRFIKQ